MDIHNCIMDTGVIMDMDTHMKNGYTQFTTIVNIHAQLSHGYNYGYP